MPVLRVLKTNEQKRYEYPPIFDDTSRKVYLSFTNDIEVLIKQLRTPSNKVFFLLLYGYFRGSNRFYTPDRFYEKDIRYACHQLKLYRNQVDFTDYGRETYRRIKQQVLDKTTHLYLLIEKYTTISVQKYTTRQF